MKNIARCTHLSKKGINCQNESSGSLSPGNAILIRIITDQIIAGMLYLKNNIFNQISDYQLILCIYLPLAVHLPVKGQSFLFLLSSPLRMDLYLQLQEMIQFPD